MERRNTLTGAGQLNDAIHRLPVAGLLAFVLTHAALAAADSELLEELRIEQFEVADLNMNRAVMSVRFSARANRSATIRGLIFDDVTINGIPVHIPPVAATFQVRAGEWIEDFPALTIRLPFRNLESLEPVRRMVSEQRARIQAVVRAELRLSLFQKLAVLGRSVWVTAKADRTVDVSLPGGALGRLAALSALLAAEPVWILGRGAVEWRERQSDLSGRAREQVMKSLVLLETRYSVISRTGETASLVHPSIGFLVPGGRVLTTAEAVEPWTFDAAIAEGIQRNDLKVDAGAVDIVATLVAPPEGAPATVSLRTRELHVHKRLTGSGHKAISGTTQTRYNLRMRDSNNNAAILLIPALASRDVHALSAADWPQGAVNVATFRLEGRTLDVILTEGRREGDRVVVEDPVDRRAFGAPVWSEAGVLGMMQDSRSAAPLDRIWKDLQ